MVDRGADVSLMKFGVVEWDGAGALKMECLGSG